MSWKITIARQFDSAGQKRVEAEWTDPTYGVFNFSKSVTQNVAGRNAFISAAIAARNAWQNAEATAISLETSTLAALNDADPQMEV